MACRCRSGWRRRRWSAQATSPRSRDWPAGVHVVPEFLGNRAPFADPHARAVIAGLGMERDIDSLVALYVAGLCGIGYGLRQIVEAQAEHGAPIERIMISGGAGQLDLVRQLLADATGKPVVATESDEPVLLGSAILGAVASGAFADVPSAMAAMSAPKATFVAGGRWDQGAARVAFRRVPAAAARRARDKARGTDRLRATAAAPPADREREAAEGSPSSGPATQRPRSLAGLRPGSP